MIMHAIPNKARVFFSVILLLLFFLALALTAPSLPSPGSAVTQQQASALATHHRVDWHMLSNAFR
jgi:hypothetical protein